MGDFNHALRLKYEQQCPDCGQSDFVEDHASGDLVCRVRCVAAWTYPRASPHCWLAGCLPQWHARRHPQNRVAWPLPAGRAAELRRGGGGSRDR